MYICAYVYMYICIYVHMYICICIYVYGHFHTKVSLFPKFEISSGSLLLNTLTQILGLLMILIKQSNQTKLKISLISLCGLNIERFPFELGKPAIFSPLFDSIWIRNEPLNGTWAALTTILKSSFLPSFVFVGLHGNPLRQVKQSPFLI